jgi:hypothetical protein
MSTQSASPHLPIDPIALKLSYLGLVPFVLGALLIWLVRDPDAHAFVALSLSAYGAVILSFLGGIQWGLGMRQHAAASKPFIWGIVPAMVAWLGVVMPAYAGLVLLGAMLVICYIVDRRSYPALQAASWLVLRFRLSAIAALSCFLAAAGS